MLIKPDKLNIGDTIGIAATSRPCDANILLKAKKTFEKMGFKIVESANLNEKYGYLAGKDEIRAQALMDLFENDQVKAVWCVSGGYGATRILSHLDFDRIKKHPKIFIGLSDVTGLHIPLNSLCHMVTFLGPTLNVLFGEQYQTSAQWTLNECLETLLYPEKKLSIDLSGRSDFFVLKEGIAQGSLVGGNLSLLCSLVGTRYNLNTKNKILILEDVNEPVYKIDRMLQQLKASHAFDHLQGLILASFEHCRDNSHSLSLKQIFYDYFGDVSFPVIYGLSCGHIHHMLTLPLGCEVELNTFLKKMTFQEIYHK